jgi:hypothetical protein
MYDFIANDGSYAHRGVWHVTDNLEVKHYEASIEDRKWGDNHTTRYIKPAHDVYTGDAICGQKDKMREGGLDWGRYSDGEDGVRVLTYRARRANVVRDALTVPDQFIPGPLCSRCAKKAGIAV